MRRTLRRVLPVYLIHYNKPEWVDSAAATFTGCDVRILHNGGALPASPVVTMRRNLGYTGGANYGIREWLDSDEPFVLICAHDCHVDPGAVDRLLAAARRHPEFGVLTFQLEEAGKGERQLGSVDGIDEWEWVSGTALLLRREMVEQIGLLDEAFRSYYEDVEYCHRARQHGWRVGVVQGAHGHGLGSGDGDLAWLYIPANSLLFFFKTRNWSALVSRTRYIIGRARRGEPRYMLRILTLGYARILLSPFRRRR